MCVEGATEMEFGVAIKFGELDLQCSTHICMIWPWDTHTHTYTHTLAGGARVHGAQQPGR